MLFVLPVQNNSFAGDCSIDEKPDSTVLSATTTVFKAGIFKGAPMAKVNAIVITGYGTNSHVETAHAVRLAGADRVDIVHFADIVSGDVKLVDYRFLLFPGGFLDGDDLGAAHAAAQRWLYLTDNEKVPLLDRLNALLDDGGLIMGICNGFQLLVKLGILPALDGKRFTRQVSLGHNLSARYEDRWVTLKANKESPCIFTRGIDQIAMPVRHGEGRLVTPDAETLGRLEKEGLIALSYADPATGEPTMEYPFNPNGSPLGIAGLTDPTGHVLGLMPHPEAFNDPTNDPLYARGVRRLTGTALFRNAVEFLR